MGLLSKHGLWKFVTPGCLTANRWDPLCLTEIYLKYLGNLPWRWSRVLWCKHHTLPHGAAQKLCHSLESLLHFLKREKKKKNPALSNRKTSNHGILPNPNCTFICYRCRCDLKTQGKLPYFLVLSTQGLAIRDNKVPENENFSSDQRKASVSLPRFSCL